MLLEPKATNLCNRRSPLLRTFCGPVLHCLTETTLYLSDPEKPIWHGVTDSRKVAILTAGVVGFHGELITGLKTQAVRNVSATWLGLRIHSLVSFSLWRFRSAQAGRRHSRAQALRLAPILSICPTN